MSVSPFEGGADGSVSGNINKGEVWLGGRGGKKEDGNEGGAEKHLERLNTVG